MRTPCPYGSVQRGVWAHHRSVPSSPVRQKVDRHLLASLEGCRTCFVSYGYLLAGFLWGAALMPDFILVTKFIGKGIFTSFQICLAKHLLCFAQAMADFCGRERFLCRIYTHQQQSQRWGAGLILSCAPADIKELLHLISLKHLQSQMMEKYRKIQWNQPIL